MPFNIIRKWFNKIVDTGKKAINWFIDLPGELINFAGNTYKYIGNFVSDPIGAIKKLPKQILEQIWESVKAVINYYDWRTQQVTELIVDASKIIPDPKLALIAKIFDVIDKLRVPITNELKKIIYEYVDELFIEQR